MKYTMLVAILTTLLITVAAVEKKDCGTNGKADWEVIKGKQCGVGTDSGETSNKEQCQDKCEKLKDCVGIEVCNNFHCYTYTGSECEPNNLVNSPDCGGTSQKEVSDKDQCQAVCEKLKDCAAINVCDHEYFDCYTHTESECEPNKLVDESRCIVYKLKSKCNDDCKAVWGEVIKDRFYAGGTLVSITTLAECQAQCVELDGCIAINVRYDNNKVIRCFTFTEMPYPQSIYAPYWDAYKLKSTCNGGDKKKGN